MYFGCDILAKEQCISMTRVMLLSYLLVAGCASTTPVEPRKTIWEVADEHVAEGYYQQAWSILADTPSGMTARTSQYLEAHPSVYEAAKDSFSAGYLEERKASGFKASFVYGELDDFGRFATPKDQKQAERNIARVFGKRPVLTKANTATSGAELASPKPQYGRVAGVQIVNHSQINTGGGAQLGALAGQALYIDNTSWGGYSATSQIGAGLLGAMVGSAMDRPTSVQFERKYWVTLNDGETVSVSMMGADNTHIPQGVCVEVSSVSISTANEANCKKR